MAKFVKDDFIVVSYFKPEMQRISEVLVIFPEKKKGISKISGNFKNYDINYDEIDAELKKLSQDSQRHILDETGD